MGTSSEASPPSPQGRRGEAARLQVAAWARLWSSRRADGRVPTAAPSPTALGRGSGPRYSLPGGVRPKAGGSSQRSSPCRTCARSWSPPGRRRPGSGSSWRTGSRSCGARGGSCRHRHGSARTSWTSWRRRAARPSAAGRPASSWRGDQRRGWQGGRRSWSGEGQPLRRKLLLARPPAFPVAPCQG